MADKLLAKFVQTSQIVTSTKVKSCRARLSPHMLAAISLAKNKGLTAQLCSWQISSPQPSAVGIPVRLYLSLSLRMQ